MFTVISLPEVTEVPTIGFFSTTVGRRPAVVLAQPSGHLIGNDAVFDAATLEVLKQIPNAGRLHDYDWLLARFEGGASVDRLYNIKVGQKGGMGPASLLSDDKLLGDVRKAFDATSWDVIAA